MASFIVYDLVFLVIFGALALAFFHKNKKNVKKQGWIFLYHSQVGIKFIDWFARKFERILRPLQYFVIATGYILMSFIIWIMGKSVWIYVTTPIPKQFENLPPIAPLLPYFPKLFNLESIFPPLYFTYFLIALAIVALSHEASHGIFARLHKIKVKTTGLAFFGPFFGAFVEPDEKQMAKKSKTAQLGILAAGTFANLVMALLFVLIMWGFFAVSFTPGGVIFNVYAQKQVNLNEVDFIQGTSVENVNGLLSLSEEGLNKLVIDGKSYLAPKELIETAIESQVYEVFVFEDAPAINANLNGIILEIDNEPITSREKLSEFLLQVSPGQEIKIKTLQDDKIAYYDIKTADKEGKAYLGVGFYETQNRGFTGRIYSVFSSMKESNVHYTPTWDGGFVQFIYDLLWWIVIINVLVALMNMLPVSILDGGRFFYLTVWGITGSEKIGRKTYAFATWLIVAALLLMTVRWLINFLF
jgi:membrane-associated protease RseP (regulator of RpoE activity)